VFRKNSETQAQLITAVPERGGHHERLSVGIDTREANQHNSAVNLVLADYKFAEIFVGCQQNGIRRAASAENGFVVDSWLDLGDVQNLVAIAAEPVDNLPVDALVRNDLHPERVSTG
jgi:hypothetical protein